MSFFTVVVLATILATFVVLVSGILSMVADQEVGHVDSLHWMMRRVELQAAAIFVVLIAVYFAK